MQPASASSPNRERLNLTRHAILGARTMPALGGTRLDHAA